MNLHGPITQVHQTGLLWLIPLFPALGAAYNAFFGHRLQKKYGHRAVDGVAVGAMALSFLVALYCFVGQLLPLDAEHRFLWDHRWTMLRVGSLDVGFSFAMDPLSGVMTLVVTGVGTLIHVYSTGYMHEEPAYWRFFCYMNLFCFAMLLLVLGGAVGHPKGGRRG